MASRSPFLLPAVRVCDRARHPGRVALGLLAYPTVITLAWAAICKIPVVEFSDTMTESIASLHHFMLEEGPLELSLAERLRPGLHANSEILATKRFTYARAALTFGSPDSGPAKRRTVSCDIPHAQTFQVLQLFGIAPKLTAVEIDDTFLGMLICTLGMLPCLASLTIVLVEWADAMLGDDGSETDDQWIAHCDQHSRSRSDVFDPSSSEFDGRRLVLSNSNIMVLYPVLSRLALRATRTGSSISGKSLHALALLCPNRLLHLELWHGLSILGDDVPQFASISSFGGLNPPSDTVARVVMLEDALRRAHEEEAEDLWE
ncbi:hypothetical protein AURDEDRAFT_158601 [Auricularia subglabra TFB-10046 SS5]|nr:hypothetical protein AURDEDRAFT_158601 [Auricularia subglabra TFB-10046 SS5]